MGEKSTPAVTVLENSDDLEMLVRGDVLAIAYEHEPSWRYDKKTELGAYHGRSHTNQLQFLIPMEMRSEYIVMYRARKSQIQIRDGIAILNEDRSVTESFSPNHTGYLDLNRTLQMSGLRR